MDTGKLNRRVQIQQESTTPGALGQPSSTWTTIYTCWANLDIQNSQLIYATAEFVSRVTHRITIRWSPTIVFQPNMRIVYTEPYTNVTTTYNIESILNPNQANYWLTFLAYALNENQ